jgi:hypothetical protein
MLDVSRDRTYNDQVKGASLSGLWVILVDEEGRKTPMLARAGNGLYLLAFRTGFTARKFVSEKALTNAEPRLLVTSNLPEIVATLDNKQIAGVLIDYDATSNTYKEAGLVY